MPPHIGQGMPPSAHHTAVYRAHFLCVCSFAVPAGVKLHRQLAELLCVAGHQYCAALRWLLAGWGHWVVGSAIGEQLLIHI